MPKFENVYCSQCGQEFGPGDHGYSSCEDHRPKKVRQIKHIEPAMSELKVLVKINFELKANDYIGYSAKQRNTLVNMVRRESKVRGFEDEKEAELYYVEG